MIKGARRVKDLIRNKTKGDSMKSQAFMRHYAMERFLERISLSPYRDKFILKGGMLVSSILGIDARTTMDIDTTMTGETLSIENAQRIISEIAAIEIDDGMTFVLKGASEIMEDSEYGGIRIPIEAHLERMKIPLKVDISTGDAITPGEVAFGYRLMLEEGEINLLAYPVETVLAEKLETAIVRGILNTRMRDYYDIYMLTSFDKSIENATLASALAATSQKRGNKLDANAVRVALDSIQKSPVLAKRWERYISANEYASGLDWETVLNAFLELCDTALN